MLSFTGEGGGMNTFYPSPVGAESVKVFSTLPKSMCLIDAGSCKFFSAYV